MKRRIAVAVLLLTGGAVVNVAVAWGLVLTQSGGLRLLAPDQMNRDVIARDAMLPHEAFSLGLHRSWRGYELWRLAGPVRSDPAAAGPMSEGILVFTRVEAGWPFPGARAVSHQIIADFPGRATSGLPGTARTESITGLVLPQPSAFGAEQRVLLPVVPLLPGFLINTVFYALLLWLLFLAPFAVRRMIRRRRGQCAKCAYPIGESPVCTECGGRIPSLTGGGGVENRP